MINNSKRPFVAIELWESPLSFITCFRLKICCIGWVSHFWLPFLQHKTGSDMWHAGGQETFVPNKYCSYCQYISCWIVWLLQCIHITNLYSLVTLNSLHICKFQPPKWWQLKLLNIAARDQPETNMGVTRTNQKVWCRHVCQVVDIGMSTPIMIEWKRVKKARLPWLCPWSYRH